MKKYLIMTALILISGITVIQAQENYDYLQEIELIDRNDYKEEKTNAKANNQNPVNIQTKNQFANDFPNSTEVYFKKTINYYQVNFKSDYKKMRAYYDFNNELIGACWRVAFTELPEKARQYINDHYKAYDILRVFLFELNLRNNSYPTNAYQFMTLFGTRFEKASTYFVELKSNKTELILKISLNGEVSFFHSVQLLSPSDK